MTRLAIIILLFWANPLWSQPAVIKSGEHDSFSRLVVYSGNTTNWTQSREGRSFEIQIPGFDAGFSTDGVFDLIPRDRILDLESSKDTLTLFLNCDCEVEIAAIDRVGLSIDVSDATRPTEILPTDQPTDSRATEPIFPALNTPMRILRPERSDAVEAFQRALTRQVGAAATKNLLKPKVKDPEPIGDMRNERLGIARFRTDRVRATSAADRAALLNGSLEDELPRECPNTDLGAIEDWENGEDFSEQLGMIRRDLFDEPGQLNPAKALEMARLYLAFGMVAEARHAIKSFSLDDPASKFALGIATMLEGEGAAQLEIPLNGCAGSSAIWALFSAQNPSAIEKDQAKTVVKAFMALPKPLQLFIGPRLAKALFEAGHSITAGIIENDMSNSEELSQEQVSQILSSELRQADLMRLIQEKDVRSAEAIVALLNLNWAEKIAMSREDQNLIQSYVFELQYDNLIDEMKAGLVRNEISAGRLIDAMNQFLELKGSPTFETLQEDMIDAIQTSADISVFASLSLRLSNSGFIDGLAATRRKIFAERLESIGLPDLAARFKSRSESSREKGTFVQGEPAVETPPQPLEFGTNSIRNARSSLNASENARARIKELLSANGAGRSAGN